MRVKGMIPTPINAKRSFNLKLNYAKIINLSFVQLARITAT